MSSTQKNTDFRNLKPKKILRLSLSVNMPSPPPGKPRSLQANVTATQSINLWFLALNHPNKLETPNQDLYRRTTYQGSAPVFGS